MKAFTSMLMNWDRVDKGAYRGSYKSDAGIEYLGHVHGPSEADGWVTRLSVDGHLVHDSEHLSRDAALRAADRALRIAIKLRELPR